jgi:hypothetical protein
MLHSHCPVLTLRALNRPVEFLRLAQPSRSSGLFLCQPTKAVHNVGELPPPTNPYCYITSLLLAADPGRLGPSNAVVSWKLRTEIILQRNAAMSTHWPWYTVCMRPAHDMKLCCYGLWHHLGTELLNANLVHHVRTAQLSAVDRKPGTCLWFSVTPISLVHNNVPFSAHSIVK